ncbi:MAG: hypothetical protein VCE43_12240 [Myxococcota bacterium]
MSGDDAPEEAQVLLSLARELAEQLAKRYRIDAEDAYSSIVDLWLNDRPLREQAAREPQPRRLKRTRAYKQAAQKARTTTYNSLRVYKQEAQRIADGVDMLGELAFAGANSKDPRAVAVRDEIVASHVSTRERLPDLEAFVTAMFELAPEPASILDVGCGLQPLLYPFDSEGSVTSHYLGLDRDRSIVAAVDAWGRNVGGERLEARRWSLSEGFASVAGPEPGGGFALALGLKLIPVLARQERSLLPLFQELPARRFLITGARQAMVKRRTIERRERASLLAFADELGFEIVGTLETTTELGLLLETR